MTNNQRPNYTLEIQNISPETIGALLYTLELQTVFAGKLYNINTFDQPGVEEGKKIAKDLMRDGVGFNK